MLFGQYLNSHRIFKGLAKALIRLCICTGWSEPLLVAHTTLLEISCRCSFGLTETKLFHFHRIFKIGGGGGEGGLSEPPLDLPLHFKDKKNCHMTPINTSSDWLKLAYTGCDR